MSETTITIARNADYAGCILSINGVHYKVTEQSGCTLTIQHLSLIDRVKSTLNYWKNKILFFYWDVVLEIEENWDAFKEWRKM